MSERFIAPRESGLPNTEQDLLVQIREIQNHNRGWIQGRFDALRRSSGVWTIDQALIRAEDGRFVSEPWSSIAFYGQGKGSLSYGQTTVDLSVGSLLRLSHELGQTVIPIVPPADTTILWHMSQANEILPAMQRINKQPLPIETYGFRLDPKELGTSANDPDFSLFTVPGSIQMTRVPSGRIGVDAMASRGIALGRLGFWQSDRYGGYFLRVMTEKSAVNNQLTIVSPFDLAEVIKQGGIPMAENHPNVRTLRVPDSRLGKTDFFAAAFDLMLNRGPEIPFAMRYIVPRPWEGKAPKHP